MKKYIKYIPIFIICFIVIILLFWFISNNDKKDEGLDLTKVSYNYKSQDDMGMLLYNRYHPEDGLLFNLIGSNNYKNYYGYYYKNKKVSYKDLSSFLKNIILINDADYITGEYDDENKCYKLALTDFNIIYNKLFGHDDIELEFDEQFELRVVQNKNELCIQDNIASNYTKTLDTYLVNIVRLDDKIVIYERVAFIEITDKKIIFYSDYNMKNKVYSLDRENIDMSFINNSEIVSNLLLEYQEDFPLYVYTYAKGVDTYYFESVKQ